MNVSFAARGDRRGEAQTTVIVNMSIIHFWGWVVRWNVNVLGKLGVPHPIAMQTEREIPAEQRGGNDVRRFPRKLRKTFGASFLRTRLLYADVKFCIRTGLLKDKKINKADLYHCAEIRQKLLK